MKLEEIIDVIGKYDCNLVEITGGEPLLQKEIYALIDLLLSKKYEILVETNGTQNIDLISNKVTRIMDIKTPGSNEMDSFDPKNINRLQSKDEVKFVICDRADYEWSKKNIIQNDLTNKAKVLFSPLAGKLDPAVLCQWILSDNLNVQFQIQLHKIIWPEDEKGR